MFNSEHLFSLKVKLASRLSAGHTYSVFKKGVVPDWEDKANVQGGRWMIYFDKNQRRGMLDDRWMEALLMVLGDHLGSSVTGKDSSYIVFSRFLRFNIF